MEEICQTSQRTKTEVLREMLRGLRDSTPASVELPEPIQPLPEKPPKRSHAAKTVLQELPQADSRSTEHPPKLLKVSSRNVLEGKVKRVIKGPVSTEVTLEIVQRIELTSTITTTSAEVLELEAGKTAYAVIKSSDVVIAME